jgi:nucleotide-binding universal stress UspA family protein
MYQKILIPLDGSERAEAILPHAIEIAQCSAGTILLLQVVEPEPLLVSPYDPLTLRESDEAIARQMSEAKAYLQAECDRLQQLGLTAECQVEHGPVVEAILEVADGREVDLIAMASHGRTGLARVLFGSVATGILQKARQPLLLIRAK